MKDEKGKENVKFFLLIHANKQKEIEDNIANIYDDLFVKPASQAEKQVIEANIKKQERIIYTQSSPKNE